MILRFERDRGLTSVGRDTDASIGSDRSNDGRNQPTARLLAATVAAGDDVVSAGFAGIADALGGSAGSDHGGGQDGEGEDGNDALHFVSVVGA